MSTEDNKAIARGYVEAWHQHNLDAAVQSLAPNYVLHFPGLPEPVRGVDAYKQLSAPYLAAFPDLQETIEDIIAEGDKVVTRRTLRGTHTGELMGMPPTGKQFTICTIDTLRIANGKIAEEWAQPDMLGLMQQLGAIPASSQAGS